MLGNASSVVLPSLLEELMASQRSSQLCYPAKKPTLTTVLQAKGCGPGMQAGLGVHMLFRNLPVHTAAHSRSAAGNDNGPGKQGSPQAQVAVHRLLMHS